jgi:hypothetical protein
MTRWNTKDLTGSLLRETGNMKSDKWELIEFPAILPSGKPVWPGFWKLEELEGVKASISLQENGGGSGIRIIFRLFNMLFNLMILHS